jgi:hypothetical protein
MIKATSALDVFDDSNRPVGPLIPWQLVDEYKRSMYDENQQKSVREKQ